MKLFAIVCSCILTSSLFAQGFLPKAYNTPLTGFEQLQETHDYIAIFNAGTGSSEWIPYSKHIRNRAPDIGFPSVRQYWAWDTSQWVLRESYNDSFTIGDNNKPISVTSYNKNLYPGYEQEYKSKYNLFYDAQGRINRYDQYYASSATSSNFIRTSITFIKYDAAGNQITDSSLYTYSGNTTLYLTRYTYTDNRIVQVTHFSGNEDITGKILFTYTNNHDLSSMVSFQIDPGSDEWTISHSDSFEYNDRSLIVQRKTNGIVYNNGAYTFSPIRYESYTYTEDNQLLQLTDRTILDGEWQNWYQTRVNYDSSGRAVDAYDYFALPNGDWSSTSGRRYVFAPTTAISKINKTSWLMNTYPNPADNNLTVELDNYTYTLTIRDITGKTYYNSIHSGVSEIDISTFESGMYILTTQTSDGRFQAQKIIVRH